MKVEAFRIEIDGKDQTLKTIADIKNAIKGLRKVAENLDLTDEKEAKRLTEINDQIRKLDGVVKGAAKSQQDFAKASKDAGDLTGQAANQSAGAYKNFQAELRTTRDSLRDLEAAGKGNSDEARTLRTRLSELNDEQRRINRETRAGGDAYRQLTSQLAATQDRIKQLNAQKVLTGQLSAREAAELRKLEQEYTRLNGSVRQIEEGVGQFQRSVGQYQNALRGVAGAFNAAALAGGKLVLITEVLRRLVRFGRDAFNVFSEFSGAVQFLGVVSGATESELRSLREEAERLGSSTAFTASEVVSLQTTFARGGFDPTEIINLGEATLNLASATSEALEPTSNLVSIIANVYKTSAEEAKEATDALVGAFNNSTLQLSTFTEAFTNVGGTASLANIEFQSVAASLGVLSDAGERGSRAGTRLGLIISELANENSKLSKEVGFAVTNTEEFELALDKLAESGIDLTKANQLVSGQNARVLATLVQNREGYNDLRGSITEATQATDEYGNVAGAAFLAASKALDSLEGDQKKLASATEGLKLQLAGLFEGGSRGGIQALTALTTFISNTVQPAFAFFAAIFEPVQEALNELIDTIVGLFVPLDQLEGGFDALKPTLNFFVGLIKLNYEGIAILVRTITRLIRIFKSVAQSIGAVVSSFASVADSVGESDNAILRFIGRIAKFPLNNIKAIGEAFLNIPNIIGGVLAVIDQIGEEIARFFESIPLNARIAAKQVEGLFSSTAREEARQLIRQREQLTAGGSTLGERFSEAWSEGFNSANATTDRAAEINRGLKESTEQVKTREAAKALLDSFAESIKELSGQELKELRSSLEEQINDLDLSIPEDALKLDQLNSQLTIVNDRIESLGDNVDGLAVAAEFTKGSLAGLKNEVSELTKQLNNQNLSDTELERVLLEIIALEGEIEAAERRIEEARNRATRQTVEPVQLLSTRQFDAGVEVSVSDDVARAEQQRINKIRLEERIKGLREERNAEIEAAGAVGQQRESIVSDYASRENALRLEFRKQEIEQELEFGQLSREQSIELGQELADVQLALNQSRIDQEVEQERLKFAEILQISVQAANAIFSSIGAIRQEQTKREIDDEKKKYDNLISLAEGNEERQSRLEKERDERVEELQREQFERQQRLSITQALINAAQGIVATFAASPGPADVFSLGAARIAQIGLIAVTTAAQISQIRSQKFREGGLLEDGGLLSGPSHSQGGIKATVKGRPIEMEGGEAIINKRSLKSKDKLRLHGTPLEIASALNSYKGYGVKFKNGGITEYNGYFEDGGLAGANMPSSEAISGNVRMSNEDIQRIAVAVREGAEKGTIDGTIVAAEEKNRLNERNRRLERNTAI